MPKVKGGALGGPMAVDGHGHFHGHFQRYAIQ